VQTYAVINQYIYNMYDCMYVCCQQAKSAEVNNSKKLLEEFRTEYDIVIAEDKLLDKSFKRDFSDVSVQLIELLYKQYRRRPR